ncbi:MAG: hypothetical protein V3W31_09400 [Thermodesulfobacteriota bacterium]
MYAPVKPVRIGLFLGLSTLIFGIIWAAFIATQHERIHEILEESGKPSYPDVPPAALLANKTPPPQNEMTAAPAGHEDHDHDHAVSKEPTPQTEESSHGDHEEHDHSAGTMSMGEMEVGGEGGGEHLHDSPLLDLAHTRLTRGHIHAMGLGLLAIAVSFVLAFSTTPTRVKTALSTCIGMGALTYPFSWILMGFRTPEIGAEAAEASVMLLVGPAMLLVLAGVVGAAFYLLRDTAGGE